MRSHRLRQRSSGKQTSQRRARRLLGALEELESRVVLSLAAHPILAAPDIASVPPPSGGPPNLPPYTPAAMRAAYGFDKVTLLNPATGQQITGDGSGQTVAIVDAYDNPNLAADLASFDQIFGLPAANLVKIDENGNPVNGQVAASTSWGLEEALDVEWAHALAPKANILLVEGLSNYNNDLYAADQKAASYTGGIITTRANVISNSWGEGEYSSETADDSVFTTPDNHATFVFSAGDSGAPAGYPSASPNVLSVGGTKLTLNATPNNGPPVYGSETGWSLGGDNVPPYNNPYIGSGGGPSAYEKEPSYQLNVQLALGARGTPDVALQADPLTGVYVLDTFGGGSSSGWYRVGGTSFSAPAWAAVLTIVNQGQAFTGAAPIGAAAQADLYNLQHSTGYYSSSNPNGAFRDITSGYNGYNAGTGYDFVTGVGTPLVNNLTSWIVYHIGPGGGGGGGTGTRIGGSGRGGNNNVLASPVESGLLVTAISSSSKETFVAATGGSVANQPIAGGARSISVSVSSPVSLATTAESYRAFTAAAAVVDNDLTPARPYAPVTSNSDSEASALPEVGKPAVILLTPEESAPSSWTRPTDPAASVIALADESPADLAMAAAMALAITGSWSALDPIEAERKQASV